MKLTVIIVNYNVKFYVEQCLYSLRKALTGIDAEICVVDNCSNDGSIDYLKPRFDDVVFIQNQENLGFSRANNIAIRRSQSKYVLLLNPDTMVGEVTIRQTIAFMDSHERAGALGVKMLNTDGSVAKESRRGIPSPATAFYKMCGLCERFPANRTFAHYYMSYLPWNEASKIEIVSGAFCLLRKSTLEEVGLLDEDFFMYGEDIDLSYRIHNKGWDVWYYPSEILHYKGESTQKTSFRYVHVFYEAMLIFFNKHYSHLSFLFSLPIQMAIYSKALSTLISVKMSKFYSTFKNEKLKVAAPISYICVVPMENRELCNKIASANGLDPNYITDLDDIEYNKLNETALTYIIYDVSAFALQQIFKSATSSAHPRVKMGFFNPLSRTLITEKNVFNDK